MPPVLEISKSHAPTDYKPVLVGFSSHLSSCLFIGYSRFMRTLCELITKARITLSPGACRFGEHVNRPCKSFQ